MLRVLAAALLVSSTAVAETRGIPAPTPGAQSSAIVGGEAVPPGMWPDTVAVIGAKGACTGTLIAPDLVLTAGHCAEIEPQQVIANTNDYATSAGTRVNVIKTTAYPSWQTSYDAAVLVLASAIPGVEPRAIATSCTARELAKGTAVRLVGFGATDVQGTTASSQLRQAMTAVTDPDCSAGGVGCKTAIAPGGEFIAGGTGTADSCFGDSGGPVMLDTPRGTVVIGAVSRGVAGSSTPCGGGGIYVRTDKLVSWIESTTGRTVAKDSCDELEDDSTADDQAGGCSTSRAGVGLPLALALLAMRRRRTR